MSVAITVTSAAVISMIVNSYSANIFQLGNEGISLAESGVENALIRLLRDPDFTGENLIFTGGTANVSVTGTTNKTIVSQSNVGNNVRKIEVQAQYNNNILTITSWKEIP